MSCCSSRLGDDILQFVNLPLGSTEGTKLDNISITVWYQIASTHSSLCEFSGPLVLAVSEQFNDSSLVWCQSSDLLDDISHECSSLAEVTFGV